MATSRAEQRAAVEDDLAVGEPLEAVRVAHLGDGQIGEGLGLLGGERDQAVLQLHGDVEDVLVVGLFELQPHALVEADQVGGAVEDLHRLRVDGALGRGRGGAHEVLFASHVLTAPCVKAKAGATAGPYAHRACGESTRAG